MNVFHKKKDKTLNIFISSDDLIKRKELFLEELNEIETMNEDYGICLVMKEIEDFSLDKIPCLLELSTKINSQNREFKIKTNSELLDHFKKIGLDQKLSILGE